MNAYLPSLTPLLVWGLFTRGLGVVFLISFTSLAPQIVKYAGADSGAPIRRRLAKITQDFPTWRRFYYFPTLLWLNKSDRMMRALAFTGIVGSLMIIYGGPLSFWGLLICYGCYLSLDMPMHLIFPWDCVLFECTLLGLFLPATYALPELRAVAAPAPALAWAYRLLLFRVMFGFGKQKFIGSRDKDLAYLKGFLVNQPLPSPLGWYVQKLPAVALKGAVVFMFFAEVPAPFFAFFPGPLSIVFALSTVLLMIGIQVMGSFGYFSLVTIVLCLPLLDNVTPATLRLGELFGSAQPVLLNAFVILHTLCATVAFAFNSWIGQSWHLWAFWYQLPRFIQPFITFLRLMHPSRWVHPYGVFPPNTAPSVKISLLVEATWDRKEWHELQFRFSPSNPKSPPLFIAPYHPRGDQTVIYDTFGLSPTSLITSLLGSWDPYPFGSKSPTVAFCQCILRGRGGELIRGAALEQHPEPPVSVRITTVMLEPVSVKEHRATGNWWKRTYIGPHVPPQELDPLFFEDVLAEPEMWHFDAIFWRRRSRLKKLMDRALHDSVDPLKLVLADAGDLTADDVERFWNEFVPLLEGSVRQSFETLPDVVDQVHRRFDRRQRRALYSLLGRFSLVLIARLEPLYLHRGLKPLIGAKTYFHLWMLTHYIVGCGREAYLQALSNPESAASHLPALTTQTGLYALSVFRFEEMTFEAQKLRLLDAYLYPHDEPTKQANAMKIRTGDLQKLPPVERLLARIALRISGFFNAILDIRDGFKGPRFDRGYPELYPSFQELDSGEAVVHEYARPVQSRAPAADGSSAPAE